MDKVLLATKQRKSFATFNYSTLRQGDVDPTIGKRVSLIILVTENYIVYLDDEGFVEWSCNNKYDKYPPDFGVVTNRVGYLESVSREYFDAKTNRMVQRLLGEGMARLFDDCNSVNAVENLNHAENILKGPGRRAYIYGASGVAVLALAGAVTLFVERQVPGATSNSGLAAATLAACFGPLGAFLSMIIRWNRLDTDPTTSFGQHASEGALRAAVGAIAGLVAGFAIEGNIVAGFLNGADTIYADFSLVGFCAGFSERIVPSIVKSVEMAFNSPNKTADGK